MDGSFQDCIFESIKMYKGLLVVYWSYGRSIVLMGLVCLGTYVIVRMHVTDARHEETFPAHRDTEKLS